MIEILIVGSNEILNRVLDYFPENKGIHITHHDNLISAVKHISNTNTCILFIDLDHHNSVNTYSISAAKRLTNNLHIIAFTEDDSLDNIRTIKEKDINDIMIKPVNENRLREIIANTINRFA